MENVENKTSLKNISIFGAFALSIGTSLGFGSFAVIGSSFVSKAGPIGTIIGLIVGMFVMIVLAHNYHYMMNKYPDNGGLYSFAKHTIGSDHAFLVSWFLIIIYSATLWANASSFALFARYIFGNVFQFGFHYSIGGYEVWLGEILLSAFFLCLFGGICLLSKKVTTRIQFGMVLIFLSIIILGFIITSIMHRGGIESYAPAFSPASENKLSQVLRIIGMAPWAFIGFESISHSTKNFNFGKKKILFVLITSVVITTLIYIFLSILCIGAYPENYSNWYEYLTIHDNLFGLDGIPAFYSIHSYLGIFGLVIFCIALFCLISTSLVGNLYALSGLCDKMIEDGVLPKLLDKKNKHENSIYIIALEVILAVIMLFFGRVLIGWVVDVNDICGIIVYTYICIVTTYQARKDKNKNGIIVGVVGICISIVFALSFMINSVISVDWIARESIVIFFVWAIVGFVFYAILLKRDKKKVFGHSMAATFGLYALIIYSIGSWLANLVKTYNDTQMTVNGIIFFAMVAILTQTVFFIVFSIIRKREVDMQAKLVLGMATMVEGRDKSTGGHIQRTSKVVELIVDEMIKDSSLTVHHRFYANLIKAAPMHDLGKIAVDDAILRKPGKFTPEEYAQMKCHSAEGAKIVSSILKDGEDEYFEKIAINVAHYHHERWDGSGYPCGLKGEEIPLEARIMAIADVYDALVSKRVYKDEFSFEEANRIILENMGTHFDKGLEKYYLQAREKIEEFYKKDRE